MTQEQKNKGTEVTGGSQLMACMMAQFEVRQAEMLSRHARLWLHLVMFTSD